MLALKAKVVVLAAGALVTPVLLLNSRSVRLAARIGQRLGLGGAQLDASSDGLDRGLAATRLEDHGPKQGDRAERFLFLGGAEIRHRAVSSARCRPWSCLTNHPGWLLKVLRLMSPAVRPIYERFFSGGLVLASIMEDLPYLDNRVLPSDRPSSDGRQRLRIQYRLHASEIERRAVFLRQLKQVFEPFRKITLRTRQKQRGPGPRLRHMPLRYRSQNQRAGPTKPGARSGQPLRGGRLVLPFQHRFESQFDDRGQRLAGGRAREPGAFRHLTTC